MTLAQPWATRHCSRAQTITTERALGVGTHVCVIRILFRAAARLLPNGVYHIMRLECLHKS